MTKTLAVAMALSMACAMRLAEGMEPAEFFSTHEPLIMDITANMRGFCRDPDGADCPDVPAVIAYRDDDDREQRVEVGLRIRGRWEADTTDCTLPSLFLMFEPEASAGTVFEGQAALPLTTHCRAGANYEQYLLTEYVAHRIYNLLAEKSLQVRLAHVTYHDASGRSEPVRRYGFFTEHFQSLADRFAAEVWSPEGNFDYESADTSEQVVVSLFQYMIGNTDWSLIAGHNIMYLRGSDWVTPVPFDLDYSGLVNARYAGPPAGLGLNSVRQRLYRGICRPDTDWPGIFAHFTRRRPDILQLISDTPGFDRTYSRRAMRYLESFFEIIESPARRERSIVSACRRP